ncbi:MAG TPA: hypothetical protein VMA34_08785 [Terracidiphilus sp.]|nr:hypothetical protein [Terracidiphilus sp.]
MYSSNGYGVTWAILGALRPTLGPNEQGRACALPLHPAYSMRDAALAPPGAVD